MRRRKNPFSNKDAEKWIELALIGVGIYVVYKIVTGVGSTISNAASSAETALQNFDQNVGLGPFDSWVSSLFSPSGTT
jgi:hypothetical protein